MRNSTRLLYTLLLTALTATALVAATPPVPVIFDTDIGNDIDDALAMAMLHSLVSRGECQLIGVTITKDHPLAAPYSDALNTFYGRGSIPVGVVKKGKGREGSRYLQVSQKRGSNGLLQYPHDLLDSERAEEAVTLLRRLLASSSDASVAIVQVGFSTNLARLLESKADGISPMNGIELARRKVKLLSVMAGNLVEAKSEFNVREDIEAAAKVFAEWPTEVVVSPYEVGLVIPYPAVSIEEDFRYVNSHFIVDSYSAYGEMPYDRPTWDLTSVLYAVRPDRGYFDLSEPGKVTVDNSGITTFTRDPKGKHRYLVIREEQKGRALEALVQLTSQPMDRR